MQKNDSKEEQVFPKESEMIFDSDSHDEFLEQLNIIAIKMDIHKCGVLYLGEADLMIKQIDSSLRRAIGEILQDYVLRTHKLTMKLSDFVNHAQEFGNDEFRQVILDSRESFSNTEFEKVTQRIQNVISIKPVLSKSPIKPLEISKKIPKSPLQNSVHNRKISTPGPKNTPIKIQYENKDIKETPEKFNNNSKIVHIKVKIEDSPMRKTPKKHYYSKFLTPSGSVPNIILPKSASRFNSRSNSRGNSFSNSLEDREISQCTFKPNIEKSCMKYQNIHSKLKDLIFSSKTRQNSPSKIPIKNAKSRDFTRTSLVPGAIGSMHKTVNINEEKSVKNSSNSKSIEKIKENSNKLEIARVIVLYRK